MVFTLNNENLIQMINKNKISVKIVKITEHSSESDRILAFTETPSGEHSEVHDGAEKEICACDLFSLFTADIIKSETLFVR